MWTQGALQECGHKPGEQDLNAPNQLGLDVINQAVQSLSKPVTNRINHEIQKLTDIQAIRQSCLTLDKWNPKKYRQSNNLDQLAACEPG